MAKSERIRFTIADDINLLMNVLCLNPYENPSHWRVIHHNVCSATGKNFTMRSVKEHMDHLLKLFVKNDIANLRKSGTEEQYEKKQKLLEKIKELSMRHYPKTSSRRLKLADIEEVKVAPGEQKGVAYVDVASPISVELLQAISASGDEEEPLDTLKFEMYNNDEETLQVLNAPDKEPSVISDPPSIPAVTVRSNKKRILDKSPAKTRKFLRATKATDVLLQYLKEKQDAERYVRQKELELEERRCAIEEKKCAIEERKMILEENRFKLEKMERERRLEGELQDRKKHAEFLQQQQNTIDFFIKSFNKK